MSIFIGNGIDPDVFFGCLVFSVSHVFLAHSKMAKRQASMVLTLFKSSANSSQIGVNKEIFYYCFVKYEFCNIKFYKQGNINTR